MIRAVLIDDEKPALDELAYQLANFEDVNIVGIYQDAIEALNALALDMPDVVFVDIDMPRLQGIELATELLLQNDKLITVFVTAYDDYAVEAFEINAVDYILKPLRLERLSMTMGKVRSKLAVENDLINYKNQMQQLNDLRGNLQKDKLVVQSNQHYHLVSYDDIIYVEAMSKKINVVTGEGIYSTRKTLSEMEVLLKSHPFTKCHRSYLVNLNQVKSLISRNNGSYDLHMNENIIIPVSKSFAADIRAKIQCLS